MGSFPSAGLSSLMIFFCFILSFCYILLSLSSLFFSTERQKGSGPGFEGRWGGTGRNIVREKESVFNKWKKIKQEAKGGLETFLSDPWSGGSSARVQPVSVLSCRGHLFQMFGTSQTAPGSDPE